MLVSCSALCAQTPRYEVKRAAKPIVVDGKIGGDGKTGAGEWAAAGKIDFGFPWDFQTGAKQRTTARLLWDDEFLYVSYDCDDTDITAQFTQRDDPTYRDDAVEIFINPVPSQIAVYYGLEMNVRAVLYDYFAVNAKHFLKRFQFDGVQLAADIRGTLNMSGDKDDGWSLEVAIPWRNFEERAARPTPGTVWTANLNRWDGTEPNRRLSMWTDPREPKPWPHKPERFGELVFVK